MKMFNISILFFLSMGPLIAASPESTSQKPVSVVRVNVTSQAYDFFRPWNKKEPYTREALGAVLPGQRVLVTAELVANSNYVELEKPDTGEKTVATVEAADYEANLAILKSENADFLKDIQPLKMVDSKVGDQVDIWQLENTDVLLSTKGQVTTIEITSYPLNDNALLIYRLTSPLQYKEGSFTVPIIKNGLLTGMLSRYDPRTQSVTVIPKPVIEHFLKAAAEKNYLGFPRAGVSFAAMRDPQLRRYVGINGQQPGGVYISTVEKGGPADLAGIKEGDVLLAINDFPIDQDGNYNDPLYGKLLFVHIISTLHYTGETLKFKIFRDKKIETKEVKLAYRNAQDYVIEPYTINRAPKYYVLGGLVLQELSRQFLKEWGGEWRKKAPQRFVYFDEYQSDLFDNEQQRLVILSHVLPSYITIGYENLGSMVVTKINDIPLKKLSDVPEALKKPINGFHKIEFEEDPKVIYLDAEQVAAMDETLKKDFGLPSLQRL